MGSSAVLQFACPDCEETIYLDDGMRELLCEFGCIVCGAGVDERDFVLAPGPANSA
ncbi:MAG: DUF7560 family zinc ribbon protein [Halobacteriota archaeon]